jgi:hypothetical protein
MSRFFAVLCSRGPQWNDSLPLEQQADWPGHADFMNALHAEGFCASRRAARMYFRSFVNHSGKQFE